MMKIYQKISLFTEVQKVKAASGYSTAWDSYNQKFRIIGPKEALSVMFRSRKMAENYAVTLAKMTFAKQDAEYSLNRARAILSNDLIEEIGEDRLFDGPLYEYREAQNEEAD